MAVVVVSVGLELLEAPEEQHPVRTEIASTAVKVVPV
jgi:hypothetical protein